MSALKQVLSAFEQAKKPIALPQLARDLALSESMLEEMIQFWVRKGRLVEVASECPRCSSGATCHFVVQMPRRYVLAADRDALIPLCSVKG